MRAPLTLVIPAAVFGVVIPVAFAGFGEQIDRPIVAALLCTASWAVIPVMATVVAYKQGFDRGFSVGRKVEVTEEG